MAVTPVRVRVIDLETGGTGPDDVCEVGWQDIERGADGVWSLSPEGGARFVDPGRPISADTMAVHHIRDEQVAGAPFWREIAPTVLKPAGIVALAAHRAAFEQRFCRPNLTGGASWICTWKCALRVWPALPRFSNQMLRYLRQPAGLDHERGLPAHRAYPDAYVTAHHLRDMLNTTSVETLLHWSTEPALLPRVPSGPDRGRSWFDLSDMALAGLSQDRDADVRFTVRAEQARRAGGTTRTSPPTPGQGVLL